MFLDDIVLPTAAGSSVRLYLRVETPSGRALTELDSGMLSIRDNGIAIEPQRVELTTVAEARRGTAAVLVLDSSRSMRGQPFDRARRAVLGYLEQMGDLDQVAVVTFDDEVEVIEDFGAPQDALREKITALAVQRKTLAKRVWDGAAKGLELIGSSRHALPRRVFMILFSDGRDSGSNTSPDALLDSARGGANAARTPIFAVATLAFGSAGLAGLESLSQGTGAGMVELQSPLDLANFFDDTATRMKQSFVASYPARFDGERHNISVQIGSALDSREADYPEAPGSGWWPIAAGIVCLAAALAAALWMQRGGRAAGELVIPRGPDPERRFPLTGRRVRIGALDDNDLVLNFGSVSRHHARVVFSRRGVHLEDLNSKNGTFINERRIYTSGSIRTGDRIRLGKIELIYHL